MAEYIKKAPPQKAQDVSAVEETARRMLANIKPVFMNRKADYILAAVDQAFD